MFGAPSKHVSFWCLVREDLGRRIAPLIKLIWRVSARHRMPGVCIRAVAMVYVDKHFRGCPYFDRLGAAQCER